MGRHSGGRECPATFSLPKPRRGTTPSMSQFAAEKFTTRSREAIEGAQVLATTSGHSTTEPIHLLAALLRQEDGTARSLVTKAGADVGGLAAAAEAAVRALPSATGATVQQASGSAAL